MRNKKGFTLIETVVCLGLISVISAAFLHVTLGSAAVQQAGNAYDARSTALVSALETGVLPDGVLCEYSGRLVISFDNGKTLSLEEMSLRYDAESEKITYYRYGDS